MNTSLVNSLHQEEQEILEQLRGSMPFRRLEEIRRLLALYDAPAPIGAELDAAMTVGAALPVPATAHPGGRDVLRGIGAAMREARTA